MTANKLVQFRIDGKIKEEAAAVLAAIGLKPSDAVRMLLTRIAREKALPFELVVPSEATIEAMRQARAGRTEKFDDAASLMADLHADD